MTTGRFSKSMRTMRILVALAMVAAIAVVAPFAAPAEAMASESVLISEFLASNAGGLADEDGDSSDWIELRNPSSSSINLAGWSLTDDEANLTKWSFPATTLPGGGHLVVFASGKDRAVAGSELHTNFKLSAGGEYLALVEGDGVTIADEYTPSYPAQIANVSYGRSSGSCDIVLEAESATLSGSFITVADGAASGGAYLTTPDNNADRYDGFDASERATLQFDVASAGTYTIDTLMRGVAGGAGDSFWVRLDNNTIWLWDTPSGDNFVSDQVSDRNGADPVIVTLSAGTHTLDFGMREDGAQLDRVSIVPTGACNPGPGGELGYFATPTPGNANGAQSNGYAEPVSMSLEHGFYTSAQSVTLSTPTPGALIRYTLDGSEPSASNGTNYTGPITVNQTTTLRAAAIVPGFIDGEIATATYLFTSDIITQSSTPAGFPTGSVNGQVLDYGMDPDIVNGNPTAVRNALEAIPTISVVTDLDNLFGAADGIYVNPNGSGQEWERPASVELIDPTGAEPGFEIDAGLRIRGGFSRSTANPKHAFRLFFRSEYDGDLEYPLFGAEGTDTFEKVDLRTAQNYSWSFRGSAKNTLLREVFSRDLQAALGQPYTRSRNYHLYLNGEYWGIYQSQERVSKEYGASYFGGSEDDYDVLKHDRQNGFRHDATDGTTDAWRSMWPLIQDQVITNAEYAQLDAVVDFDSLIDAQLIYVYTGDIDGTPSRFLQDQRGNNWYSLRNRTGVGEAGKWQFFVHDGEHALGARDEDPDIDRTGPFPTGAANSVWSVDYMHPYWIHNALMSHPDYVAKWESRANEVLRGNGPMTAAASLERWNAREAVIAPAVLAESARWGDAKSATPFTVSNWANAVSWVENTWFPVRTQNAISHLGLPAVIPNDPPVINDPAAQSSTVADLASLTVTASDPQGQAVTWAASGLPNGLSIDADTGVISGRAVEAGTFLVTLTATDTLGASDTATFSWTTAFPSPSRMILNEWNAVDSGLFLKNGGTDSALGTVLGNGGDWFELVVIEDNLDLRGWTLEISEDNGAGEQEVTDVFEFANQGLLASLRAGTIITVSEDFADDVSYDPAGGDWNINLQANSNDDGAYFTADSQSNFGVSNDNWQLTIRDAGGNAVFGPAGEGAPAAGVSSDEIGELEADPSGSITPASLYDDGSDSTFGEPNGFDAGFQDFSAIRPVLADTVEPDAVIDSPADRSVLTDTSVTLSGTATDNVGVDSVRVAIKNRDTGEWLQDDGSFGAGSKFLFADVASPGAAATAWSFTADLPEARLFAVVRAEDTSGIRDSTKPKVLFEIEVPVFDVADPNAEVVSPTVREELSGPSVVITGTATDDSAVSRVRVTITDRATGERLQADGSFAASFARIDTVLSNPGATSTDWSFPVDLADGEYTLVVDVIDGAGKQDPTRPRVVFSVSSAVADTVAPDTTIDSPTVREALAGPAVTALGTATDNVGVTRVRVTIQDVVTKQYLQADGTFGGFNLIDANLDNAGALTTGWSLPANLPAGEYAVQARAVDAAGNTDDTRPRIRFSVN